jgi:hypothetical protein
MTLIREVLADRQLSFDQAQVLIRQQELRDILKSEADEDNWQDLAPLNPTEQPRARQASSNTA